MKPFTQNRTIIKRSDFVMSLKTALQANLIVKGFFLRIRKHVTKFLVMLENRQKPQGGIKVFPLALRTAADKFVFLSAIQRGGGQNPSLAKEIGGDKNANAEKTYSFKDFTGQSQSACAQ
jgi:hypothetical protein